MSATLVRSIRAAAIGLCVLLAAQHALAEQPIGKVSAAFGDVSIKGASGTRKATVATPFYNGDMLVTGPADAASLLLDSKAVVKLDANTELRVVEGRPKESLVPGGGIAGSGPSDTQLDLDKGAVEVFLAKRPEGSTVHLTDTIATIDATGTVFDATYSPATHDGIYACQESKITVHPAAGGPATVVSANQLARVRDGKLLGIERLNRQELRSNMSGVQALKMQTAQRSAKVSQQRSDALVVRNALQSQLQSHGKSIQSAAKLADLLSARCADLDNLAAQGANASGVDGTVKANNGVVSIDVFDGAPDGDVVSIQARSCTDANLKTVNDHTISKKLDVFPIQIDVPNVLEINFKDINDGTVPGNGVGLFVTGAPGSRPFIATPLANGVKQKALYILVTK